MYSLEEVEDALDKGILSDALYKMEQFARSRQLAALAEWCRNELQGYPEGTKGEAERDRPYRTISVQWQDMLGRPITVSPEMAFVSSAPIWSDVHMIEEFAKTGALWQWEQAIQALRVVSNVPIAGAFLPPEGLQALLQRIRFEARARLNVSVPRIPLQAKPTLHEVIPAAVPQKVKILFLSANPSGTTPLRLDEEVRTITEKLRASEYRRHVEFVTSWAVRPDDLLQNLNEHSSDVIHLSGHGDSDEIVLSDADGNAKPVSQQALLYLLKTMRGRVRLVVLNACYSQAQAEAITQYIPCAIGMSQPIRDQAAIVFAASLYRAIGFGRSIQESFEQGVAALMLEGIPDEDIPRLLTQPGIDASTIFLVDPFQVASAGSMSTVGKAVRSRIRREWDGKLRVGYADLERRGDEWIIPGEGILHLVERDLVEIKRLNNKADLVCADVTAIGDAARCYRVISVLPL